MEVNSKEDTYKFNFQNYKESIEIKLLNFEKLIDSFTNQINLIQLQNNNTNILECETQNYSKILSKLESIENVI